MSTFAVALVFIVAANSIPAAAQAASKESPGETLVKANDCISCHAVDRKVVGPSYQDVAKKYKGQAGAVAKLVAKVQAGGAGNWGQIPMTAHPNLTPAQLKTMVQWILSLAGPAPKAATAAGKTAGAAKPEAEAKTAPGAAPAPEAAPASDAKMYEYPLPDGTKVKLDYQLYAEGKESEQKVTKNVFHGYEMYDSYCYRCHGQDATGSEIAPDLRNSLKGSMTQEQFLSTAMAGRQEKGMPSWAGFLTEEEVRDIYQYVKGRSAELIPVGRPPSEMD